MAIIQRIVKRIYQKIFHESTEENNHRWLKAHGLREGEHVDCFSWSGMDFNYPGLITLGNYITISSNVKILAHDASVGYLTQSTRVGVVEIGDHAFIGACSIILPNVRIGEWSIIGAGSVVTKDVPPHSVVAGNPAKIICTTEYFKEKHEEALRTHPVSNKPWREWHNASVEEWAIFREQLKDSYGYVTRRTDLKG